MKKFPQIKWYQTDTEVILTINEKGDNYNITQNDNFLNYKDDIYECELELFDSFTIIKNNIQRNNLNIILNKKNENNEWDSLLKNSKLYKYFISVNWDKFINTIQIPKEDIDNMDNPNFNEEEFNYLLESGALDKISSDSDSD